MHTREIAPQNWRATLEQVGLSHDGSLVSVEVRSRTTGAQPQVLEWPLTGLSTEWTGARPVIAIMLGQGSQPHVTHVIDNPTRVYVERTDEGADTALEIESGDGMKTILRFRPAPRSEPGAHERTRG